jgi:hypothetical protein
MRRSYAWRASSSRSGAPVAGLARSLLPLGGGFFLTLWTMSEAEAGLERMEASG